MTPTTTKSGGSAKAYLALSLLMLLVAHATIAVTGAPAGVHMRRVDLGDSSDSGSIDDSNGTSTADSDADDNSGGIGLTIAIILVAVIIGFVVLGFLGWRIFGTRG